MHKDVEKVLVTEEEIRSRVKELGRQITADYEGTTPVVICILKGAVPFFADLIREIGINVQIDFLSCSSYGGGTKSTGEVEIRKDISMPVSGRDVLLVEDIIDSGNTLSYLKRVFIGRGVRSFRIATLLDKPARRSPTSIIKVDYTGFVIPDEFVIGYGLDYSEDYRNLPYVGVLKRSVYEADPEK